MIGVSLPVILYCSVTRVISAGPKCEINYFCKEAFFRPDGRITVQSPKVEVGQPELQNWGKKLLH